MEEEGVSTRGTRGGRSTRNTRNTGGGGGGGGGLDSESRGIRFTHNARSADPFKSRADERSSLPRMETSLRSISGCRGRRHCGRWCRADRFSCNIRCDMRSSRGEELRVAVLCISKHSSYGQLQGRVGFFRALRLQNNRLQQ